MVTGQRDLGITDSVVRQAGEAWSFVGLRIHYSPCSADVERSEPSKQPSRHLKLMQTCD